MTVFSTNRPLISCALISSALMLGCASFSASAALSKQNLANSGYWGGILLPNDTAINASELNTIYNRFVDNYIVDAGTNMARVKWGSGGALRGSRPRRRRVRDGRGDVSRSPEKRPGAPRADAYPRLDDPVQRRPYLTHASNKTLTRSPTSTSTVQDAQVRGQRRHHHHEGGRHRRCRDFHVRVSR